MTLTRRELLENTVAVGATLLLTRMSARAGGLAEIVSPGLAPYLTGQRIAATPATDYRAYRSRPVQDPAEPTWIQVDLGRVVPIDGILLYPASERMFPGRDQYYAGEGFPLRFRLEAASRADMSGSEIVADLAGEDFPDVGENITRFARSGVSGRYIRLTATRLRPVMQAPDDPTPTGNPSVESPSFTLVLAKIGVISGGSDVAVGCAVTGDKAHGKTEDLPQLTRAARQDGEQIHWDNPRLVTEPTQWARPAMAARVPRSGVTLGDGVFRTAMENNVRYLLDSYRTEDLLRQFYERAGRIKEYKPGGLAGFWEEDLAGSNAGRFLMGAGNTLRWLHNPELRQRLDAVVDGIEACKEPNGYIMAYPAGSIFYSERAAYTRAWLTHGLLEASLAGNSKALQLLRDYYDWFNNQKNILPELLRGAVQGGQGMVANTRVALSPIGKPADIQTIQRYFEEPQFLAGLADGDPRQIWQYPYDRPHCYLLTNLEAYMDIYLVTGDTRYYRAVSNARDLYRQHWMLPGGSISIIEFQPAPPDSNYLHHELGESCGSSFWVFLNQRFHQLHPQQEHYIAEIERSIYNVAIANQDGSNGFRYHTHLEGTKEKATRINTCCEGQCTRLIGSLPEHIYSLAEDGIYINLFADSTISWEQQAHPLRLKQETRFPFDNKVRCTLETIKPVQAAIRVRIPAWASQDVRIVVNGEHAATGQPGAYMTLDRKWKNGDTIELTVPTTFRFTRYKGADQLPGAIRYAIEYGPLLYAVTGTSKAIFDDFARPEDIIASLEPVPGKPMQYKLRGHPGLALIPYWQVSQEEFTCFPALRISSPDRG